jgi:predicted transcriptional regulator
MATSVIETQTETAVALKEPPKYLSHVTGKPNKNRSYYFTNIIATNYPNDFEIPKERYIGKQDWKKIMNESIYTLLKKKTIIADEAKQVEKDFQTAVDKAFISDRNKEIINPEYTKFKDAQGKPVREKSNKAKNAVDDLKDLLAENEELKKQLAKSQASLLLAVEKMESQAKEIAELKAPTEKKIYKKKAGLILSEE